MAIKQYTNSQLLVIKQMQPFKLVTNQFLIHQKPKNKTYHIN